MEDYKYIDGVGTTAGTKAGGFKGDVLGAVGGAVISSLIGGLFAKGESKKALALQNELGKLSLAQQKQLEERLQDVQSENQKLELAYKYLAVQNNNEMLNKVQSKRYTSYIVLGVGATILALVFLKLAKRKNG